ncbi:unnamed protein product, partial [Larinioides sclopetarius]
EDIVKKRILIELFTLCCLVSHIYEYITNKLCDCRPSPHRPVYPVDAPLPQIYNPTVCQPTDLDQRVPYFSRGNGYIRFCCVHQLKTVESLCKSANIKR